MMRAVARKTVPDLRPLPPMVEEGSPVVPEEDAPASEPAAKVDIYRETLLELLATERNYNSDLDLLVEARMRTLAHPPPPPRRRHLLELVASLTLLSFPVGVRASRYGWPGSKSPR